MLSQTSNKQARGAKAVGEICSVEKEMERDLKFAICKTPVQLLPFANAPLTRSHLIRRVFSFFSVMSLCDEFGIAFCGALHLPAPRVRNLISAGIWARIGVRSGPIAGHANDPHHDGLPLR